MTSNHRSRNTPRRIVALPKSFPLFRVITKQRRPSLNELDAALLVCDTLLQKVRRASCTSVWDLLAGLSLPASQESWLRALFMDLRGPCPSPRSMYDRESCFSSYITAVKRELRAYRAERLANDLPPARKSFSVLEGLFE